MGGGSVEEDSQDPGVEAEITGASMRHKNAMEMAMAMAMAALIRCRHSGQWDLLWSRAARTPRLIRRVHPLPCRFFDGWN